MLRHKQKHFIKYIVVGLFFLLSLGLFNSGKIISGKALAAGYKCNPQRVACCQTAPQANSAEDCKSSYIVFGDPQGNHPPELGHCYTAVKFGTSNIYQNASCVDPPFNAYQQAPTNCDAADLNESNCQIIHYLVLAIDTLSGLVGVTIVAVIVISGIQFSAAGNDPQKVASARGHIVNALLALLVFLFMFAFLQWLVPGGIF